MDYNDIVATMFENLAATLRSKSGNSNIDKEKMDAITDMVCRSTIKPEFVDRTGVLSILNCTEAEFYRLKDAGLIKEYDNPNLVGKNYLLRDIEELKFSGVVIQRKQEYKRRKNRL